MSAAPLVLVLVGTDHHPFDRLVHWVDRWAASTPDPVRVLVQRGTSAAPEVVESVEVVGQAEMDVLLDGAGVVVSHGGPGTIARARRHGCRPVVVPRDPALGEHVDDHQILFSRRMAEVGDVLLARTEAELVAHLEAALRDPGTVAVDLSGLDPVAATCTRFAAAVAGLFSAAQRPEQPSPVSHRGA